MGAVRNTEWTEEENVALRQMVAAGLHAIEIARAHRRSRIAIAAQGRKLGLAVRI